jgi:hypothetical protein
VTLPHHSTPQLEKTIMITLHQFARTWDIPNLSHFCTKIETYLRMAQLPYQIVETLPLKAPRGKLPYIEDNGKKIADSRLIIHYLKSTYCDPLDTHLSIESVLKNLCY